MGKRLVGSKEACVRLLVIDNAIRGMGREKLNKKQQGLYDKALTQVQHTEKALKCKV